MIESPKNSDLNISTCLTHERYTEGDSPGLPWHSVQPGTWFFPLVISLILSIHDFFLIVQELLSASHNVHIPDSRKKGVLPLFKETFQRPKYAGIAHR